MGHTHYMYKSRDLTEKEWEVFTHHVRKCFQETDIPLAGWDGTGVPLVNHEEVSFNGAGTSGCETCKVTRFYVAPPSLDAHLDGPEEFSFCKTRHAPYDPIVIQVYALAKAVAPDAFRLSSDGGDDIFPDLSGSIEMPVYDDGVSRYEKLFR